MRRLLGMLRYICPSQLKIKWHHTTAKMWWIKHVRLKNPIPTTHNSHIIRDMWFNNYLGRCVTISAKIWAHRFWLVLISWAAPLFLVDFPSFWLKPDGPDSNGHHVLCWQLHTNLLKRFNMYQSFYLWNWNSMSLRWKLLLNTFFSHLLPKDLLSWLGEEA